MELAGEVDEGLRPVNREDVERPGIVEGAGIVENATGGNRSIFQFVGLTIPIAIYPSGLEREDRLGNPSCFPETGIEIETLVQTGEEVIGKICCKSRLPMLLFLAPGTPPFLRLLFSIADRDVGVPVES